MKGGAALGGGGLGVGVSPYPLPPKKRWKGLVIAVLGLVILSMLVPLVFLLGLHNGFHSTVGSVPEKQSTSPNGFGRFSQHPSSNDGNQSTKDQSQHMDELMKRLGPGIPKDFLSSEEKVGKESKSSGSMQHQPTISPPAQSGHTSVPKTHPVKENKEVKESKPAGTVLDSKFVGEDEISCEQKYGSYCLWRREYREDMKDSMVKTLKDRLFVARAYYPSIAKLPAHDKLSRELRQNIQDFERVLSEATVDADLPPLMEKKLQKMDAVISKSKSLVADCNNVDKKLRQLVDLTEDETSFHTKQSAFLYQLAVQTMPKSLHCLSMRLTVEYFRSASLEVEYSVAEKFVDPTLYHYVVFSNNILASTVVINSTVMHAKENRKLVFHVLTDKQNYFAMKLWFLRNTFKEAAVQVLNIEDPGHSSQDTTISHLSLPEEFRVSFQSAKMSITPHRTEYISQFSYSHYMLPVIFRKLEKVVVLDDDVVVQRDLSELWRMNLEGKVNAAVEHCDVTLGLLKSYLGGINFDGKSCAWMSGLNVIDLARWRDLDLSGTFEGFVRELNIEEGGLDRAVASHASLLTFQDLVYPLDGSWVLSGLGHNYDISVKALSKTAVLHYNGNMKPWLELGIPKFKSHWKKYLNREDQFMTDCNVSP